jgi:hypothetical protein
MFLAAIKQQNGNLRELLHSLVVGLLARFSIHQVDPSTGHLGTGILGVSMASSKFRDGAQVTSCYFILLMRFSRFKLIRIASLALEAPNYIYKL